MKLGFLGTGAITSAIVTGLNGAEPDGYQILVSPRNASVASSLAKTFPTVTVAATNQAVLDGSDVVMLAVRPQVARQVLHSLRFRPDHQVISLLALTSVEQASEMVAPAAIVARAIPLPLVATRSGVTVIYPDHPVARAIFDSLGTTLALGGPDQFNAFSAATATLAPYLAFAGAVTDWLVRHEVPHDLARHYVATMFHGLATMAVRQPAHSFAILAQEFATSGGINEQAMAHLVERGAFAGVSEALDGVLQRMADGSPAGRRHDVEE